ncbi:unnamed protein product [Sphacelaria rigidula]
MSPPSTVALFIRWHFIVLPAALLTGNAFIIPGSGLGRHYSRHTNSPLARRHVSTRTSPAHERRIWRCSPGARMASVSPTPPEQNGDGEEENEASGAGDSEPDSSKADAANIEPAGGESETTAGETDATTEEDVAEVTRFSADGTEELSKLKLIDQDVKLPISWRSDNGTRDSEFYDPGEKGTLNPYYDVVRRLSPTELIGRFMRTAPPRVQEAVRTTVLGLLGSLPRHAFETTAISTGDALANLMFQLQMTGYMFKNAEYRLSLQSSMRTPPALLPGEIPTLTDDENESMVDPVEIDDDGRLKVSRPKVSGKIKLTYNEATEEERALEVDADAYMKELRGQVEQLQSQLLQVHEQKDEAFTKDLLLYIKSMPESQLQGLTTGVSPEVLEAMRLLVETVMGGMGNSEIFMKTLTQQTGASMAQLCMWQLVVGFNLRELEAREDMRKTFDK